MLNLQVALFYTHPGRLMVWLYSLLVAPIVLFPPPALNRWAQLNEFGY